MKKLLIACAVVLACFGFCGGARADYFVWQDPATGLSFSFPDTWQIVSNADPEDMLTVMAPSGRAHAACRVRQKPDRRYVIYPQQYRPAIQKTDFSIDFWIDYLSEFEHSVVHEVMDGAGLGRSVGSYAIADFKTAVQGPYMDRTGIMLASLYNDRLYVLECSSHKDAFETWKKHFMSIMGSVDFRKEYHENITGHYRNFLEPGPLRLKGDKKGQTTIEIW